MFLEKWKEPGGSLVFDLKEVGRILGTANLLILKEFDGMMKPLVSLTFENVESLLRARVFFLEGF
mgnify:CR=1